MSTTHNFRLSVLRPLMQSGGTLVDVFIISAPQDLQWMREHADELAALCCPGVAYCALNVEPAE